MSELQRVKQVLAQYDVDNEALAIDLTILALDMQKEVIAECMSK